MCDCFRKNRMRARAQGVHAREVQESHVQHEGRRATLTDEMLRGSPGAGHCHRQGVALPCLPQRLAGLELGTRRRLCLYGEGRAPQGHRTKSPRISGEGRPDRARGAMCPSSTEPEHSTDSARNRVRERPQTCGQTGGGAPALEEVGRRHPCYQGVSEGPQEEG